MQIIPNRRKDRILVRVPYGITSKTWASLHEVDARPCKLSPSVNNVDLKDFIAKNAWPSSMRRFDQPFLISIPVTTKTKAEMARKLRSKFKTLTGTIKWTRGQAS